MITYGWHDSIPADLAGELTEMLAKAAEYDAEAGFSNARPDAEAAPGSRTHHLIASMLPRGERGSPDLDRLPEARVVAYLRLDVLDGVGEAQFVVRAEFRSLGVATLLMELLRDEPDGLASVPGLTAVAAWSHGAHPAAERMSWRFEASPTRLIYKTIMLLGGSEPYAPRSTEPAGQEAATAAPEIAPGHSLGLAPADLATRGRIERRLQAPHVKGAVLIGPAVAGDPMSAAPLELVDAREADDVVALLDVALADVQAGGARVAQLYVDLDEEEVLHVSRELGFFHDQSDCRYVLTVAEL